MCRHQASKIAQEGEVLLCLKENRVRICRCAFRCRVEIHCEQTFDIDHHATDWSPTVGNVSTRAGTIVRTVHTNAGVPQMFAMLGIISFAGVSAHRCTLV